MYIRIHRKNSDNTRGCLVVWDYAFQRYFNKSTASGLNDEYAVGILIGLFDIDYYLGKELI